MHPGRPSISRNTRLRRALSRCSSSPWKSGSRKPRCRRRRSKLEAQRARRCADYDYECRALSSTKNESPIWQRRTGCLRCSQAVRGWSPEADAVFNQRSRGVSPRGHVHRQDTERRQTGRLAGRTAGEVRVCDQSQRPPGRLASQFRNHCCCARIRWSSSPVFRSLAAFVPQSR